MSRTARRHSLTLHVSTSNVITSRALFCVAKLWHLIATKCLDVSICSKDGLAFFFYTFSCDEAVVRLVVVRKTTDRWRVRVHAHGRFARLVRDVVEIVVAK